MSEQSTRVRRPRRRIDGRHGFALGAFAAVAVLAMVTLDDTSTAPTPRRAAASAPATGHAPVGDSADGPPVREVGEPCPGPRRTLDLATVLAGSEVVVHLPSTGRLTRAGLCGDTPVLLYDDAVEISYESGWAQVDPAVKWAALSRDNGGRTEQVAGRPAYVRPPAGPDEHATVLMLSRDVLVRLLGKPGVPVERLVELGSSIALP